MEKVMGNALFCMKHNLKLHSPKVNNYFYLMITKQKTISYLTEDGGVSLIVARTALVTDQMTQGSNCDTTLPKDTRNDTSLGGGGGWARKERVKETYHS